MLSLTVLEPCEKTKKPDPNCSKSHQKKPKNKLIEARPTQLAFQQTYGWRDPSRGSRWLATPRLAVDLHHGSLFDFNFSFFFELKIKCIRL
jgi:hypothetical protein